MKHTCPLLCAAAFMVLSAPAAFSLGFRIADQNSEATARGDAFAATADNPSAIWYNPAGISQLEGTQVLVGSYAASLRVRVQPEGPGQEPVSNTNREFQYVPQLFLTSKLPNYPITFGLGVYAPYGLALEYPDDTPFRTLARKGKIVYLAVNPVISYQVTKSLSVAIGPSFNFGDALLEQGVIVPGDTFKFRGDGVSYSFGAGLLWKPCKFVQFGLTYHSRSTMDFEGHSTLDIPSFLAPTPFGPVQVPATHRRESASASFNIPQNLVFGVSFRPADDWNIEFNADWTDWSNFNTVTLKQKSGDIAIPFNWQSSWFWEFGVTKKFSHGLQASVGYIWSENSVPESNFNPIVPDSSRHCILAGFGQRLKHWNWNIAYEWAYGPTRTINNGSLADGTYRAQTNALNFSLGYNF